MDIALIIDESGSIRGTNWYAGKPDWPYDTESDNWYQIKQFVNKLIDVLTITVTYSQVSNLKHKHPKYVSHLINNDYTYFDIPELFTAMDY